MSETLTEEEKERIRVELLTEIAKNEQDLEQFFEMERIENARLAERIKIMEEQIRRWSEARIEKERIEKAEAAEKLQKIEEQLRRSEKARIEIEREMEEEKKRKNIEEKDRHIRDEKARIEREKMEKEVALLREAVARIKSEKAETEERERQEEEGRRLFALRETSATKIQNCYRGWRLILKAKEELKEKRERNEKERIKKEAEERRLFFQSGMFPLLALPYKLKSQIYRFIDLEGRRALRINEELAEIELKMEYRYERLRIEREEDHVWLSNWIRSGIKWKMCYEVLIPIAEIEKELEIMGKNTQFDYTRYTAKSGDRQIINGLKSLKTKNITVKSDSSLNDADLCSLVENKEEVIIWPGSTVTLNVLMWIYENMRDGQFELNKTSFGVPEEVRWNFLDKFGNFDRESLIFTGTNPNQKVCEDDVYVKINQGKLTVSVYKKKDEVGEINLISFHFDC